MDKRPVGLGLVQERCTLHRLAVNRTKWSQLVKHDMDANGQWDHGERERCKKSFRLKVTKFKKG